MKNKIIRLISLTILTAFAVSMAACGSGSIYDSLAEDNFDVKVRFEADGAVVNETQNVTIVEVYSSKDTVTVNGKTGISILSPEDSRRGQDGIFKLAKTDGKNNFFLAGWYRERTLRTDASGNALDAYGIPTKESGREQGYVYSGKWDFEKDVIDPAALEGGEFTLYAAWVPFFTYEFYEISDSGEEELIGIKNNKLVLTLPQWNDRKGEYNMKDFPKVDGKIFDGAYLDTAMLEKLEADLDGRELFVDYEKGIALETNVKIYVKWAE